MANAQDLLDVSDYNYTENKSSTTKYYKPSPDSGINGVYKAVVRFVPYVKSKEHSLITKYETYLKDPETGTGKYVDSYRTINEKCPIQDAFFTCYHSKDASIEQHKDEFSQRQQHYANVQILQDPNKPENVGKIMTWKFGKKIHDQIEAEENPGPGKRKRKPFDVFEGRPFSIEIYKKGDWPNYDRCKFISADDLIDCPSYLGPNGQELDVNRDNPEDVKVYAEYILENSPDITVNAFKPWDDETKDYVTRVINTLLNNEGSSQIKASMTVNEATAPTASPVSEPETTTPLDDDIADDLELSKAADTSSSETIDEDDILANVDDIDLDDL